ncbi:hypothetical protein CYMTET_12096 [Cymbomonas tetramitiformis]|uniref:Uncharacterized protein n=1 Tax=Cymbomonas tetramitiformis TaxID=36881 RepID=A0AAE0GL64_9CHLO|nr:hypothetical protein CYMTET_12096 [Cymbomonas tetramitiformis]
MASESSSAMTQLSGHPNNDVVTALRLEVAAYMYNLHQELLRQYPVVYQGLPAAAPSPAANASVPPGSSEAAPPEEKSSSPLPSPDSGLELEKETRPKPPSDPSPPPSLDGDPAAPRLEVLLWTLTGESFWLKPRQTSAVIIHEVSAEVRYRLPSLSGQSATASSEINPMWLTLQHIGLDIRDLAAHGSVRSPLRLTEVVDCVAFALLVDKAQVNVARREAEARSGPSHRRLPLYSWVTIPATARESELEEFDSLGVQIWAPLIATEDYIFSLLPSGTSNTGPLPGAFTPTSSREETQTPPAASTMPFPLQRPRSGILPVDSQRAQFPGHHELTGDVSPDTVYRESKTVADIMKLCKEVPMYPTVPPQSWSPRIRTLQLSLHSPRLWLPWQPGELYPLH